MNPLRIAMFLVLPMAVAACGSGYDANDANHRDDRVGYNDDNPVTPAPAASPARTAPAAAPDTTTTTTHTTTTTGTTGTTADNRAYDQGRYDQVRPYDGSSRPSETTRPPSAGQTADREVTPFDQGEDATDVRITADIRRSIMTDKSMSMDAQNVKIITNNGVTTLRGQVDSDAEKQAIEAKAKTVNGVVRVDDQLEVKPARTDKRVD